MIQTTGAVTSCPHCGEDRQIEQTDRQSVYVIRGRRLRVWLCSVCGREFMAPGKDAD